VGHVFQFDENFAVGGRREYLARPLWVKLSHAVPVTRRVTRGLLWAGYIFTRGGNFQPLQRFVADLVWLEIKVACQSKEAVE